MKKDLYSDIIIQSLEKLNDYNIEQFHPIYYEKKKIGWINEKNLFILKNNFSDFCKKKLVIEDIFKSKINIFDEVFDFLIKKGEIKNLIREKCPVFNSESLKPKIQFSKKEFFGKEAIFNVERNILTFFGFPAYGVHCNGWVKEKDKYFMILGKRSDCLKNFPGYYDNLIGGGQPSNLSLLKNLFKEAYEETGLSEKIMRRSTFSSIIKYLHIFNGKLHSSVIAIYNIEITEDLILQNQDGEISGFEKLEISEIFKLLERKLLKPNCIIPIVDFMLKRMSFIFSSNSKDKISKILYKA